MTRETDQTRAEPPEADAAQAWRLAEHVGGWMTRGQSDLLAKTAAACPPAGLIVEIGSFQGRSMIVLALCAPPSAKLVAIDPHAGNDRGPQEIDGFDDEATHDFELFHANLAAAGVADRVRHVRAFSDAALDVVDGAIDVLYIDGAHRYRPALSDITKWGDRVRMGGVMLIHDSFSSIGVTAAIGRRLMFGGRFEYVTRSRSLALYRRVDHVPRTTNAARQALQLGWFAKNVGQKVFLTVGGGRLWKALGRKAPEWPY